VLIHLDNLDDPRLAPYRCLKDRHLNRDGARFIAEGRLLVERLLVSAITTESVLSAQRVAESVAAIMPADIPHYVVPDALLHDVVGFKFHSGALACGRRPLNATFDAMLGADPSRPAVIVVCPKLIEHENLGSIIRSSAALGAAGLVLGPQCCDAFWRKCVRVSMGTVFTLPIRRSEDLAADLRELHRRGVVRVATVLDARAEPLRSFTAPPRCALLMGAEDHGLDDETLALCDRRVTIPMRPGVDSLNVAITAALMLHHVAGSTADDK